MTDFDTQGIALLRKKGARKTLKAIDKGYSPQAVILALFDELGSKEATELIIASRNCLVAYYALQYGYGIYPQEWWKLVKISWGF